MTDDAIRDLKSRIDHRLNEHLLGMKEGWDDSIVGFNEAWDIVLTIFADEAAKATNADPFGRTAADLRENGEAIAASLGGAQATEPSVRENELREFATSLKPSLERPPTFSALNVVNEWREWLQTINVKISDADPKQAIVNTYWLDTTLAKSIDDFVAHARAEERERCAKVAEDEAICGCGGKYRRFDDVPLGIAAAIRNLS
jgi:hypothetical protein